MKVCRSAELLLGQQRQHGLLLADHSAGEGVDGDEQRELRRVLPQPETDRPLADAAHSGAHAHPSGTMSGSRPHAARKVRNCGQVSPMLSV